MFRFQCFFIIICLFFSGFSFSVETPEELYGNLPGYRSVSISPDGEHFAYIQREGTVDYFVVKNVESKKIIKAVKAEKFKARSTDFATNKHVIFRASKTGMTIGYRGRRENSGALVYNIETGKIKLLLKGTKDIHPAQTGLGYIVGLHEEQEVVYMPAFHKYGIFPYNLYRVNLNSGMGKIYSRGTSNTVDWFVGFEGAVLAREEFDERDREHRIQSKTSGEWKTIYSLTTPMPSISVHAVSPDEKSLLFVDGNHDREAVFAMSLDDGEISGPIYSKSDSDIEFLDTDINRRLTAVVYSGFKSSYEFVDSHDSALYERLATTFPMSNIYYESTTQDKKKVVVKVTGADAAGAYMLFDTEQVKLQRLASEYLVESIGELKAVRYKARDGLSIPAVITFPVGEGERKKLPLIALPHGGPESYDNINFDWLAQYFSAKGYMVLQPNFRGSTGFGFDFRNAGRGRWGREMQDDVSDGIDALVAAGYVDPSRVCIVGASYGGYSALAGGAFSPELYRCVVAINGVADIPLMMRDDRAKYGGNHWVISYWEGVIGDRKKQKEKLEKISPVNFAGSFRAPVLLIHGADDTVVPIKQSIVMNEALEKAEKNVTLIKLKGEDHWLSSNSSRIATLKAINNFLEKYNPVSL